MKMQKLLVACAMAGLMAACAPSQTATTTDRNDSYGTDTDATEQTTEGMGTDTDTNTGTGTGTDTGMGTDTGTSGTGTDTGTTGTGTDTGMGTDTGTTGTGTDTGTTGTDTGAQGSTDQDMSSAAGAGNVPQNVQNTFQERFPDITPDRWVPTDYGYYATFTKDGDQYIVNFSAVGDWISTNQEITQEALPEAVRNAYTSADGHENATDERFLKVETPQFEELYIIQGKAGTTDYIHYYTPDGRELQAAGSGNESQDTDTQDTQDTQGSQDNQGMGTGDDSGNQ